MHDLALLYYESLVGQALSYHKNPSTFLPSNRLPFASQLQIYRNLSTDVGLGV
ncbi:hypothetical protein JMJ77_0005531 [Colletotrichum scovillei]|uniref:Uncharacterized protein n=1 Tax=Colletotrichum scovillei TaxID=1209932 RepID=A0A9P7RJ77_9PEZI|nr:hypothetical protein JMJ77_0005531 [Colletotrichum scovillei]KAG7076752.1 hypothetical protein JMJ76_0014012 [Colletotrichum scovillei]KAG7083848.1 hypothetical protein JMJ78_0009289 [Colletotrichum scovillei]